VLMMTQCASGRRTPGHSYGVGSSAGVVAACLSGTVNRTYVETILLQKI
jgi:hypothetical protein